MEDLVSRCGYRCDLCLAFRDNIRSKEDQQKVSDGWFRIYGFRIQPEKIHCDGCLIANSQKPELIDRECPVRPCVLSRGLENCACCAEYPCCKFKQRMVVYEAVASKLKEPISQEDYESFVKPYENKKMIEKIRVQLRQVSESRRSR